MIICAAIKVKFDTGNNIIVPYNTKKSVKDQLLEDTRKLIYVTEEVGEWNLTS